MARTPYSVEHAERSRVAHMSARRLIYPQFFQSDPAYLDFEDCVMDGSERNGVLDGDMSIDRIVRVTVTDLYEPIPFTVQERFRDPSFSSREDITLTEWNPASNTPSELYKMQAQLFCYGYYDADRDIFFKPAVIDVAKMLLGIAQGSFWYERLKNKRTEQPFLCIKYEALRKVGAMLWESKRIDGND